MINEVVISVGSNIETEKNVKLAEENISEITEFIKKSNFYITKPQVFLEQDDFLNGAFLIKTDYSFDELNSELKKIEIKQKRVKTSNVAGPRTIDLDIVVWNDEIKDENFYEWDFLKKVVLELKPNLKYTELESK